MTRCTSPAPDGRSLVLLALEDYESRNDTEYLLSNPVNAARLLKSINDLRNGIAAIEHELIEPRKFSSKSRAGKATLFGSSPTTKSSAKSTESSKTSPGTLFPASENQNH